MASVPSPAAAKSVHYADEAAYTDYVNDPSKQSPHSGISAGIRHRIYKRRWFMLFLSFLLNLANSAIWIAVPTAQDPLAKQGVRIGRVDSWPQLQTGPKPIVGGNARGKRSATPNLEVRIRG